MKIFLDVSFRKECTVWFEDGNVQTLKGNIEDICIRIRNYVIDNFDDEEGNIVRRVQTKEVYLDTMGEGSQYVNILKSLGVEFKECTYYKLI